MIVVMLNGKFIEMRSSGDLDTVKKDYNNDKAFEIKEITNEEWSVINEGLKKPTQEQELRILRENKLKDIADAELLKEGKIDFAGKLIK